MARINIPHKCADCSATLYYNTDEEDEESYRNYVYINGVYYCKGHQYKENRNK